MPMTNYEVGLSASQPIKRRRRSVDTRTPAKSSRETNQTFTSTQTEQEAQGMGEPMKRIVTKLSLLVATAIFATGCVPVRHNLPPEQRMLEPGPGVGGPGPGVLGPPAMAPGMMGGGMMGPMGGSLAVA